MKEKNVFVVGPEATGPAFIGRKQDVQKLRRRVLESKQSTGTAVIGPYRIGKSSLVSYALREEEIRRMGRFYIKMVMKTYISAYHFWYDLLAQLNEELLRIQRTGADDPELTGLTELLSRELSRGEDPNWYIHIHQALTTTMRRLKILHLPVVLVIDEFDYASEVFKGNPSYFSLLRTFGTGAEYLANTVLIARHELHTVEEQDPRTSNLANAYDQFTLRDLTPSDMEDYYAVLADCNVFLDEEAKARLHFYAGTYPYLLSMFGSRMGEYGLAGRRVDCAALDQIHRECLPMIGAHYKHLTDSLAQDRDLEKLMGITVGPCLNVTLQDRQRLETIGYLKEDEGDEGWYAISHDFSQYLYMIEVNFPAWELIMETERKLKRIFSTVYPRLEIFQYEDLATSKASFRDIEAIYPTLSFNASTMMRSMENMRGWTEEVSVLDVLTLNYIIQHIKNHWDLFRAYFGGKPLAMWEEKLDLINNARMPMAHSHGDIVVKKLPELRVYCQHVLDLTR